MLQLYDVDKSIKLWALQGDEMVAELKGHRRGVWALAFSPVDKVLASASADDSDTSPVLDVPCCVWPLAIDTEPPPPYPHAFVAPVRRPRVLRVPGARADRAPRGGPDSAGRGGPRGEIDAPEDDQAAHPQPARAQQVIPGARVCRQRVPAARVGREARGRHDSASPGGPSDEQRGIGG